MKLVVVSLAASFTLLLAAAAPTQAAPVAASATAEHASPSAQSPWATWITRDIQIDVKDLPKPYSCDALWYKLHGVLLAIGAREYMAVTPYKCGPKAAGGGESPTLDLKFQTLRALSGADAQWAQTRARWKVVRLAPGEPKILDSGDCALLSQLNGTLFTYLDMHIVSANLQCSGPPSAQKFSISVDALIAQPSTPSSAQPSTRPSAHPGA